MANNNQFSDIDPLWAAHRPYVEMLSRMTGGCIFVVERNEGYHFMSPNLEKFGYEVPQSGNVQGTDYLKERVHPEERTVFDNFLDKLFDYLITTPAENLGDYKYIFEFRIMSRAGEWVRVICQLQILGLNRNNNLLELGTIDISPDQTDTGLRFTLMNVKTGEIVPFALQGEAEERLTKREMEILAFISGGMYSKEISEQLSISIHTVNRHRQNILEKMGAGNTTEAINYARRLGLLA
jgi:DNA-binding CsgD family transcriptional regulator